MYENLKRLPKEKLIYTDTDSCIMEGDFMKMFKIGKDIGEFKIEHENKEMIIYGRKTYLIGEDIKIAGFRRKEMTREEFEKGIIENRKMVTIKNTKDINKVGSFEKEVRDLKEQEEQHNKTNEIMEMQKIYIDKDIENINYFSERILKIVENR